MKILHIGAWMVPTELILVVEIVAAVCCIALMFNVISNFYIKRNASSLYSATLPLSVECKDAGVELQDQTAVFNEYIDFLGLHKIHRCSRSVLSGAERDEIKYLIKYSQIDYGIDSIERIDFCVNFLAKLSTFQENMISLSEAVKKRVPVFVRIFASGKRIAYTVCNVNIALSKFKSPRFVFLYVSPAGRSRRKFNIQISESTLRSIQEAVSAHLCRAGHSKAQRSAMTNDLREAIKKRDNYTCCICGNSVFKEPNLLLEVDHIVPISKGGKTEASNLQTLCWRCNRAKSNK